MQKVSQTSIAFHIVAMTFPCDERHQETNLYREIELQCECLNNLTSLSDFVNKGGDKD